MSEKLSIQVEGLAQVVAPEVSNNSLSKKYILLAFLSLILLLLSLTLLSLDLFGFAYLDSFYTGLNRWIPVNI